MKFRIKEICRDKGITITALAQKIGVKQVSLSRAIHGKPNIETLERIAAALGVPIADLFEAPAQSSFVCPVCGARLNVVAGEATPGASSDGETDDGETETDSEPETDDI
jgi:transcriptional regulator with XRE-family HTH domain